MKSKSLLLFSICAIILGCNKQGKEWELSRLQNTIDGYQHFISQYPESVYADSARQSICFIHYKLARSENTINAFQHFLSIVPNGQLAEKARSDIQAILNDRHPAFQQVDTIQWNAKSTNDDGKFILRETRHIAQQLFNPSGIELVNSYDKKCDAQILITAKGTALGAYYRPFNSIEAIPQYSYTGAYTEIQMEIIVPNEYAIKKCFRGTISPSDMNVRSITNTKDAPWERTVNESGFVDSVVKIVNNILGPTGLMNCLLKQNHLDNHLEENIKSVLENASISVKELAITALDDYNEKIRCRSIELLKSLKDTTTVPIFISVLRNDKSNKVRSDACNALSFFYKQCPSEIAFEALNDSSSDVRQNAIHILREKKDYRAIRPLILLLEDQPNNVRSAASWALQDLTGQHFEKKHPYHHLWSDRDKYRYWNQWLQEHQNSFNK